MTRLIAVHTRIGTWHRSPRYDAWTPADDESLRALYADPSLSRAAIAQRLGRSVDAVQKRAHVLGIRKAAIVADAPRRRAGGVE